MFGLDYTLMLVQLRCDHNTKRAQLASASTPVQSVDTRAIA
jgi:hypothetical protein